MHQSIILIVVFHYTHIKNNGVDILSTPSPNCPFYFFTRAIYYCTTTAILFNTLPAVDRKLIAALVAGAGGQAGPALFWNNH